MTQPLTIGATELLQRPIALRRLPTRSEVADAGNSTHNTAEGGAKHPQNRSHQMHLLTEFSSQYRDGLITSTEFLQKVANHLADLSFNDDNSNIANFLSELLVNHAEITTNPHANNPTTDPV